MQKILVIDSYHTDIIAEILKSVYGDKAEVETSRKDKKFDIIFLSAMLAIEMNELQEVKEKYALPGCKIVAMSVTPEYLEKVKDKVDLCIRKEKIWDKPSVETKEILVKLLK